MVGISGTVRLIIQQIGVMSFVLSGRIMRFDQWFIIFDTAIIKMLK